MVRNLVVAVVLSVFVLIPLSSALAADNGPGCGWGTMLFSGNKKVVHQVLAATTNGFLGNQTFGISTGTLGCTNNGIVMNDQKVTAYASVNFENLKQEMAQGHGEYLASLAALLGVSADRQSEFFALMQERYTILFKSAETTPSEMLIALNQEISSHPALFEEGANR